MKQTVNLKWVALCILLVVISVLVLGIVGYNATEKAIFAGVDDRLQEEANDLRLLSESYERAIVAQEEQAIETAKDIVTDDTVEVINPDLHIATLTKNTNFNMELEIGKGRGYVPSERNKKEGQSIGAIPVDSVFAPVRRVNFHVEDTRVGQVTDYDRLVVKIWTNGSIDPKEALLYASHILQRHLEVFAKLGEVQIDEDDEEETKEKKELLGRLNVSISELELSVRSNNCLREARIKTIGDLVKKTEQDMLQYRNFGKKSLNEISALLKDMGLSFGMQFDAKKLKKEK